MKKKTFSLIAIVLLPLIIVAAIGIYNHIQEKIEKELYPLPEKYLHVIKTYSEEYNVPIELLCAVINTESSFDPSAQSHADARGIMQITEETFNWLQYRMGIEGTYSFDKLLDYEINIKFGTYFLSLLYEEFNDWDTALAAYNAGRGSVNKWLDDPNVTQDGKLVNIPFEETRNYIQKVNKAKEKYIQLYFSIQPSE
ncbi:MAG: lytic transglycosylase domain-containing protein [Clostridia bacterium]|nr:lytic transglycosylase domain-containing protein [Clostridia bacterium]